MADLQSSRIPSIDPIAFWSQIQRCCHGSDCRRCCWPWRSTPAGQYGQVVIAHRRYSVHRVALELIHGALLLPGILVCHTCDNPPCCNPRHLYAGTVTDNRHDQRIHGAFAPARCAGYVQEDREALHEWLQLTESHAP